MGMFLEAIDLMAASFGLQLRYQLFESPMWFAAKARILDLVELIPFARISNWCPLLASRRHIRRRSF